MRAARRIPGRNALEHDLIALAGPQTFKRGMDYLRQGRVVHIARHGRDVVGHVQGRSGRPYETEVSLDGQTRVIDYWCSCPVNGPCKHVVALALAACGTSNLMPRKKTRERTRRGRSDSLQEEQTALEQEFGAIHGLLTDSHTEHEPVAGDERLGYLWSPPLFDSPERAADSAARVSGARLPAVRSRAAQSSALQSSADSRCVIPRLSFFRHRLRQDGTWGKPQVANPLDRWNGYPSYVAPEDRGILDLLQSLDDLATCNPKIRSTLFEWTARTGRSHWGSVNHPLAWSDSRLLDSVWSQQEDGSHRLDPVITPSPVASSSNESSLEPRVGVPAARCGDSGVTFVVEGDPWLYIDTKDMKVGPLRVRHERGPVERLLKSPPLPAKLAEAHHDIASALSRTLQIDAPRSTRVRDVSTPPVPLLRFTTREPGFGFGAAEPLVEVRFRYGKREIGGLSEADQVTYRDGEGNVVRHSRDDAAEQHAVEQLRAQGALEPVWADDSDILLAPTGDWTQVVGARASLEAAGYAFAIDDDFPVPLDVVHAWYLELDDRGASGWFDWSVGARIHGEDINLVPAIADFLARTPESKLRSLAHQTDPVPLRSEDGRTFWAEAKRLSTIINALIGFFQKDHGSGQDMGLAAAGGVAATLDEDWVELRAARSLREHLRALARATSPEGSAPDSLRPVPKGLKAKLRLYQHTGFSWMGVLHDAGLGGVLADDMGLGKTVQFLSHVLALKEGGSIREPALVVAPTSVLSNWQSEVERFAPALRCLVYRGPGRKAEWASQPDVDLLITNYALLQRDADSLAETAYSIVCYDEAQALKNPRSKVTRAAASLSAGQQICMTGTPVENHLGELWSIMSLVAPGLLGSQKEFQSYFQRPIEKRGDTDRLAALRKRVTPCLLRRKKNEVARELPAKIEQTRRVPLTDAQRDLYESVRATMHQKVRREIARKGLASSNIVVLDALLKLRQVCCHPALLKKEGKSAKYEELLSLVSELVDAGRTLLVFSQFVQMLRLIEQGLDARGISTLKLTGRTKNRKKLIERFQNGDAPVFLISLKAGGTGLNLTRADTVIHYDPWWNPAVEDQATDRAHRIGQTHKVLVERLVCEHTVEEMMLDLQSRKRALAEGTLEKPEGFALREEDIDKLFAPLA